METLSGSKPRLFFMGLFCNGPLGIACLGFVGGALLLHNWVTLVQQGLSGAALVSFPARPSKPHTGSHRGEFGFSLQNEFTPPPKGGGAGYRFSWVGRVCSARSQRGHSGPTGPVRGFPGVRSPTRLPKPHTTAHRGGFGLHRFFLVCFFCGSPANWRSRW